MEEKDDIIKETEISENKADEIMETVTAETVSDNAESVSETIQNTVVSVSEKIAETAEKAEETAMENVTETAENITESVQNTAENINSENESVMSSIDIPTDSTNTETQPTAETSADNQPRRPVYDKFMYEPIGFEGFDKGRQAVPNGMPYGMTADEPKKKSEFSAVVVLAVILVLCVIISIIGISYDIANSGKNMPKAPKGNNVVLYSEKKPEGANNYDNFKDENGKYTIEGVAELVRPSIVEIYVYNDVSHSELVGTGSGVVISEDGYIVTNAHVLSSDCYHTIKTIDGKEYGAQIIGRDAKTDIAVIKVNSKNLTPAVLGDSDETIVGEAVIAIGNPAQLSSTVTNGIVSAVDRKVKGDSTGFEMNCIQTNADISPGNSGGALVDMYGHVIGITSSKYASSLVQGLGFAITINEAKPIIEELISNGFIGGRFRIGIQLIDMGTKTKRASIEEEIKTELPKNFKGIYISDISEDCDIANTELKAGDFITKINGVPVSTYDELYDTISSKYKAGDTVPATCARIKNGEISYFNIEFKLMEDTSGNY